MDRWPAVDRALRRRLLDDMRRRRNREQSLLTPAERFERLSDLLELAGAFHPGVRVRSDSDESLEVLRRLKARFRASDGQR